MRRDAGPAGQVTETASPASVDEALARVLGTSTPPRAPPARTLPAAEGAVTDAALEARSAAGRAQSIEALAQEIAAFDGCPLKAQARRTVVYDGIAGAPVLVIGEAPGAEEDRVGKPFVGPSGQLLDRMLGAIGLSRTTNVLITNTIYWRPPGNRKPLEPEVAVCRPFLARFIELAAPRAILLVGGTAAETVLRRVAPISRLRGQDLAITAREDTPPIPGRATFHPSYLLRRPQDKRLAWQDLLQFEALLHSLGIETAGRP